MENSEEDFDAFSQRSTPVNSTQHAHHNVHVSVMKLGWNLQCDDRKRAHSSSQHIVWKVILDLGLFDLSKFDLGQDQIVVCVSAVCVCLPCVCCVCVCLLCVCCVSAVCLLCVFTVCVCWSKICVLPRIIPLPDRLKFCYFFHSPATIFFLLSLLRVLALYFGGVLEGLDRKCAHLGSQVVV